MKAYAESLEWNFLYFEYANLLATKRRASVDMAINIFKEEQVRRQKEEVNKINICFKTTTTAKLSNKNGPLPLTKKDIKKEEKLNYLMKDVCFLVKRWLSSFAFQCTAQWSSPHIAQPCKQRATLTSCRLSIAQRRLAYLLVAMIATLSHSVEASLHYTVQTDILQEGFHWSVITIILLFFCLLVLFLVAAYAKSKKAKEVTNQIHLHDFHKRNSPPATPFTPLANTSCDSVLSLPRAILFTESEHAAMQPNAESSSSNGNRSSQSHLPPNGQPPPPPSGVNGQNPNPSTSTAIDREAVSRALARCGINMNNNTHIERRNTTPILDTRMRNNIDIYNNEEIHIPIVSHDKRSAIPDHLLSETDSDDNNGIGHTESKRKQPNKRTRKQINVSSEIGNRNNNNRGRSSSYTAGSSSNLPPNPLGRNNPNINNAQQQNNPNITNTNMTHQPPPLPNLNNDNPVHTHLPQGTPTNSPSLSVQPVSIDNLLTSLCQAVTSL